jgi:hypothetical protein
MRLGKVERQILELCLWLGSIDRQYIYETLWPKEAKMIKEHDLTLSWNNYNEVQSMVSQSLKALKREELINDKDGYIALTLLGKNTIQKYNVKDVGFKRKKPSKRLKNNQRKFQRNLKVYEQNKLNK